MTQHYPYTVIVVEDTYDDIQMVSKILEFHGITVHIAQNGVECMALLEQVEPDAVITDLAMPSMDGWQVLEAIGNHRTMAHIPVIAVTAYDSSTVEADARGAGFSAYFAKPLSPRDFVQQLANIISNA